MRFAGDHPAGHDLTWRACSAERSIVQLRVLPSFAIFRIALDQGTRIVQVYVRGYHSTPKCQELRKSPFFDAWARRPYTGCLE